MGDKVNALRVPFLRKTPTAAAARAASGTG